MPQNATAAAVAQAPSGAVLPNAGGPLVPLQTDAAGNLLVTNAGDTAEAVAITASSGNVANASAVATLAAATGKTTHISGFSLTASGSTAALPVEVTVAGVIGGTMTFIFDFAAGVLVGSTPLSMQFNPPLPASAADTAIVVTLPAGGAGNTNAAANAWGFQQ